MAFELSGKLFEKYDTIQVSDRFRKREFVVEKTEQVGNNEFTDYVKFQLTQDRCDLIDPYTTGETIKIAFNVKGNKWERDGKVNYFTNLDAWKIEKVQGAGNGAGNDAGFPEENAGFPGEDSAPPEPEGADDLPF